MARAKNVLVQLDVDQFCDLAALAIDAEERSQFLMGFIAGIRGTIGRSNPGPCLKAGYQIGKAARDRREGIAQKCAVAGAKGFVALQERLGNLPFDSPGGSPRGGAKLAPMGEKRSSPGGSPMGETGGAPMGSPGGSPRGDTTPFFRAAAPQGLHEEGLEDEGGGTVRPLRTGGVA